MMTAPKESGINAVEFGSMIQTTNIRSTNRNVCDELGTMLQTLKRIRTCSNLETGAKALDLLRQGPPFGRLIELVNNWLVVIQIGIMNKIW